MRIKRLALFRWCHNWETTTSKRFPKKQRLLITVTRFNLFSSNFIVVNPKRAGGGAESAPLDIFCYISAGCYFFALKLHDVFSSSLALDLRPFKKKIGPRVTTRRCVIERWVQRKTDQKLIFNGNYTQIVFFVFRIHFHYVLSYKFGLFLFFGVRTCVSILWHTSLSKNATFAWKNSEKPWFWRFLVIFVFLTWRHLWRHCGVIQGMFVLFLVPMDSGGL